MMRIRPRFVSSHLLCLSLSSEIWHRGHLLVDYTSAQLMSTLYSISKGEFSRAEIGVSFVDVEVMTLTIYRNKPKQTDLAPLVAPCHGYVLMAQFRPVKDALRTKVLVRQEDYWAFSPSLPSPIIETWGTVRGIHSISRSRQWCDQP